MNNFIYPDCFLHFFDIHFLNEICRNEYQKQNEMNIATKIAILCCEKISLPLSSFCENQYCYKIVSEIKSCECIQIRFISEVKTFNSFINIKLNQYESKSRIYNQYISMKEAIKKIEDKDYINIIQKKESSSGRIIKNWKDIYFSDRYVDIFESVRNLTPPNFRDNCLQLDERIDGRAYIPEYIYSVLDINDEKFTPIQEKISQIINQSYFESYIKASPLIPVIVDMDILDSSYLDNFTNLIPYSAIYNNIKKRKNIDLFKVNFNDLLNLKNNIDIINIIRISHENYFEKIKNIRYLSNPIINNLEVNIHKEVSMSKFINNGNVQNMGENININGNNTQAIDLWNGIEREFKILEDKYDNQEIKNLHSAIINKNMEDVKKTLSLMNLSKDFLVSIGANIFTSLLY